MVGHGDVLHIEPVDIKASPRWLALRLLPWRSPSSKQDVSTRGDVGLLGSGALQRRVGGVAIWSSPLRVHGFSIRRSIKRISVPLLALIQFGTGVQTMRLFSIVIQAGSNHKKLMPLQIIERYLKAAERHIAIGEVCIARQRAVIARLERHEGHKDLLREATRLLAQFLQIQILHLADRDRLICELNRCETDRRIAEGRFRIAQQQKMIFRLESHKEDSRAEKNQLALLEGTQAALRAHRDRLDVMGAEDAQEMGRVHAALLSLLRASMADTAGSPHT